MRYLYLLLLTVALVLGQQTMAAAVPASPAPPPAVVKIGENTYNVGWYWTTSPSKGFALDYTTANPPMTPEDREIFKVKANPDPSITTHCEAINLTSAPMTFGISFGMPISMSGPTSVNASIWGSFTDIDGLGGFIILGPTQTMLENSIAGFTWGTGSPVLYGPGQPGSIYTYGPFTTGDLTGPVIDPSLFPDGYPIFSEAFFFTLSPGDSVILDATCEIVPLPASLLLMGSGLLGLAAVGLRKKKA